MAITEGTPRSFTPEREKRIRRLLGLPAEPPNIRGAVLVPYEDCPGIAGRLHSLSEEERAAEALRWHQEGWRGRLASDLADLKPKLRGYRRDLEGRVHALRAGRALAAARSLHYRSSYIHRIGAEQGVEGYFDLPGDQSFGLTVYAATAMTDYAQDEWSRGEAVTSHRTHVFGGWEEWVVAPADHLDDEIIKEAITRWYQQRFEFVQGHWSQAEGRLPEIVVELAWETQEQAEADWKSAWDHEHGDDEGDESSPGDSELLILDASPGDEQDSSPAA